MLSSRFGSCVVFTSLLAACGGAPAPASPADGAASETAPTAPAAPKPVEPASSPAQDSAPPESSADAAGKDGAGKEGSGKDGAGKEGAGESDSARNVKYAVSPDGMRVDLEGVSFVPKAEAVKSGAGYAIKVRVEARAKDGNAHSLLAPEGAEVAIAGVVKRSGQADPEMLSDHRDGDREIVLKDKPATLTRVWPAAGGPKPLAAGDEAEFMVGIWGLGADKTSRRPLKKFCKISVKFDKGKPRVVVGPPDGVSR